ncbi:Uncharacterised protein [Bordetella pertussis]|nr:Uncharacterised protein [Bordetella pertussis]
MRNASSASARWCARASRRRRPRRSWPGAAPAAVHAQDLPGNEAGVVRQQKRHRGGDLGRRTEPLHGNRSLGALFGVAAGRMAAPEQLGLDRAGRHRVDGDAILGQFQRPGAGAPDQGALGGRITGAVVGSQDGAATDIDDPSAAPHLHRFDEGLGDLHRHAHVQVEHAVERGQVDLAERLRRHDADIVDHRIDREFVADLAQHLFGAAGVGQVAGVEIAREVHIGGIARDTHYVATQIGQPLRQCPADAFGGTCHQHAFVLHGLKPRHVCPASATGSRATTGYRVDTIRPAASCNLRSNSCQQAGPPAIRTMLSLRGARVRAGPARTAIRSRWCRRPRPLRRPTGRPRPTAPRACRYRRPAPDPGRP